jgi:hypothetical protein
MYQEHTASDQTSQTSQTGKNAKTPLRGEYCLPPDDIPQEIRADIASKLGSQAEVFPAREEGSYRGPVIYADERFIGQAVGKNQQSAIVHRREDVEIVGAALNGRDANNDLKGRNIQVHYQKGRAKAYPWDAEKERQAHGARAVSAPDKLMDAATRYANENIKNTKQRETFLKHLNNVAERAFSSAQQQQSPVRSEPAPAARHHADIER